MCHFCHRYLQGCFLSRMYDIIIYRYEKILIKKRLYEKEGAGR